MPSLASSDEPRVSVEAAFRALRKFLQEFGKRSGNLITLLGDVVLMDDGKPTDLAAWSDWLDSLEYVEARSSAELSRVPDLAAGSVSVWESFLAMSDFVWAYGRSAGDDLPGILHAIEDVDEGHLTSSEAWNWWLASVKYVRSGGAPRY